MNPKPMRIEDYIAGLSEQEQRDISQAETAIDVARLLYHAREHRQLTQAEAAEMARMRQQAISRLERPGANIQLATLQRYLDALGYTLELTLRDAETGELIDRVHSASRSDEHSNMATPRSVASSA